MHQGHHAAHNIHQQIQHAHQSTTTAAAAAVASAMAAMDLATATTATGTATAAAEETDGELPKIKFLELSEVPPMIGLAIGKQAVAYWPEGGMVSGEETLGTFFGKDLGFSSKSCSLLVCLSSPFGKAGCFLSSSLLGLLGGSEVMLTLLVVCWNHLRLGEGKE